MLDSGRRKPGGSGQLIDDPKISNVKGFCVSDGPSGVQMLWVYGTIRKTSFLGGSLGMFQDQHHYAAAGSLDVNVQAPGADGLSTVSGYMSQGNNRNNNRVVSYS